MSEISKTRKQSPRSMGPTDAGASSGSPAYPGQGTRSQLSVGDPPGSPSYFGQSGVPAAGSESSGGHAPYAKASAPILTVKAVGDPPGGPSYFGSAGAQAYPGSRRQSSSTPSGASVGHPPGSPAYYGGTKPAAFGAVAAAGPASYAADQSTRVARLAGGSSSHTPVGPAPGSAAYLGRTTR